MCVHVQVPGLMENRPSVLKGDHLFISHSSDSADADDTRRCEYKGYVHEVHSSQVCLGFSDKSVWFFFILNNFPFASSTSSTLLLECLDGSLWNYYSTIPISFTTEDLGKPGLTHSKLGSRHNNSSGFLSLLSFDTSGWAPVKVLWKYYSSMSICLTTENFGSVFNRYQSLFWKWWKSRSVGIATKSWLLFKSLVWLVVYYRCDSLMLKSAIVDRIKWFEMKASRQILQVTWIEKRTKDWYYGKLEQNLFCYSQSRNFLLLWIQYYNIINMYHSVVPASRGSAPSSGIWNNTTLHSPKQKIWLRTALCRGWCRRMAWRNLRVACQKRRQRQFSANSQAARPNLILLDQGQVITVNWYSAFL